MQTLSKPVSQFRTKGGLTVILIWELKETFSRNTMCGIKSCYLYIVQPVKMSYCQKRYGITIPAY